MHNSPPITIPCSLVSKWSTFAGDTGSLFVLSEISNDLIFGMDSLLVLRPHILTTDCNTGRLCFVSDINDLFFASQDTMISLEY